MSGTGIQSLPAFPETRTEWFSAHPPCFQPQYLLLGKTAKCQYVSSTDTTLLWITEMSSGYSCEEKKIHSLLPRPFLWMKPSQNTW